MGLQNSNIIICKNIKLEKGYKDVLDYSEADMLRLCEDNAIRSANNYSFIRSEKNLIKTSFLYEDALKCNYMAFQNPDYSNKWFFAFIDDVEYANDGTSKIRYTIDEFSTWFDYWNPSPCFVEREHVNDDRIGVNTVPEGLETGEYIINSTGIVSNKLRRDACYVCISVSYVPDNTPFVANDRSIGNIYSGLINLVMASFTDASKLLSAYDNIGRGDAVQNVYMIPSALVDIDTWLTGNLGGQTGIRFAPLPPTTGSKTIDDNLVFGINNTLDGYTPKNNKLYTSPFNFLSIANNCGTQMEFKYEDFTNVNPTFKLVSLESAGCPTVLIPKNYKRVTTTSGLQDNLYSYGIVAGKFPICSWKTDLYTNWMTQNGVNILGMQIDAPTSHAIRGSIGALVGGATLSGEGISGGFGDMLGAVTEMYQHSMQSPAINGQTSVGDLSFTNDMLCYTYYKMSIRSEFARIIDDWFSRFGYKVNRVKLPNQTGRAYWNFVKIGSYENIGYSTNTTRSVPSASMEVINNIYRSGVTIWHNHENIGNYSLNNTING